MTFGYDIVVPAVDALVDAGVLGDHVRMRPAPYGTGWQSSFRAGPLLRALDGAPGRIHRRPVGEVIRMRGEDGRPVAYTETRFTRAERRRVESYNACLRGLALSLAPEADVEVEGSLLRFPLSAGKAALRLTDCQEYRQKLADGRDVGAVVDLAAKELYRVFNGSFQRGGRFYGGAWQTMPKSARKHLLIGGQATAEVDFTSLHPRLLYAYAGKPSTGDAYAIPGIPRRSAKLAFNILLNANCRQSALGALQREIGSRPEAEHVVEAVLRHHRAVRHLMHSGLGLRLQAIDADIACKVLDEMLIRRRVPCLPVHDSFIVPVAHKDPLTEVMDTAFREVTGKLG